ncbi:MAG TPA: malate synthase A [Gemmatimonadales bacterium]|nr:malate synthase A [Gemmatimonadales bacterium]
MGESGVECMGSPVSGMDRVLTRPALDFLAELLRRFEPKRRALLDRRRTVRRRLDAGELPGLLPDTAGIRGSAWQVAPSPADLTDRRVEITGPVERKMMINALNSGARVFMADFEDALSPPWTNVVTGQINCIEAVRRALVFTSPDGRRYELQQDLATLVVRPRGWHLEEKHLHLDGHPVSASLVDFGLYFFHNAHELLARGSGPYFYLPKLESHLEARLWNDVFVHAQAALGVPRGSVRATVLIETVLAAFEMDEILYELREHAAGLNAGRWDYLFSIIKCFHERPEFVLPDRAEVTMAVPFMQAYARLLVATCHRRGAHAIGGMAAFVPSRKDPAVNATAFARVQADKAREAREGFDGAWVAHPDLVPVVSAVFNEALGRAPHQKNHRPDVRVDPGELLDVTVPGGRVTDHGVKGNVNVAIQYLAAWLAGSGAVAINNLMEDAATAEIARSQLWQWIRHAVRTAEGTLVTRELVRGLIASETEALRPSHPDPERLARAAHLLDGLVAAEEFPEFLTLAAYEEL